MRKVVVLVGAIALIWSAWSAPGALASGASPQFSFSTDESGATFTCALDGGAGSACTSPKTYSNLASGQHSVTMTSSFTAPTTSSTLVGQSSVEATADSNAADQAEAWSYTASASGTASSISFYVGSGNTAPGLSLGLYSDSSGAPGTLLSSATVSSPKAGAWNTATLSGGVSVTAGTKYWLAALGTGGGTFTFRDVAGGTGCISAVSSATNLSGLPSSFGEGETWQGYCPASLYVTGNVPGSAASPQFSFSTDESGATFTCALDGGAGSACTSPKTYSNLASGQHSVTMTSSFTAPTTSSTLVGQSSVEATADSNAADQAEAWSYTASASGTASSISFYVGSGNTAPGLSLGLYSDSSGAPGTLLSSATVSSPKAGAWNTATLSGGVSVTAGTKYWLAALGTGGGTFTFRDVAGGTGCISAVSSATNLSGLPSSFGEGETWQGYCPASLYVAGGTSPVSKSLPAAPVNSGLPVVSGTDQVGDVLTASSGSWSNSPTSYGYQWEDCNSGGGSCVAISGATSSSHTLASSEAGDTVRVVVTATNAGGSGSATSAATSVVTSPPPSPPANTALPAVSGTDQVGDVLTASSGSWSNSPTSYGYQWEDCNSSGASCAAISGATSSSHTLAGSEAGDTIRVVVTATNAGGSGSATSQATSVVTSSGGSGSPANTAVPTVSGANVVGDTLSASSGGWSNSPTSYAYQWQDCVQSNLTGAQCSNISGATSSGYAVQSSDVGNTVRVVVTASNSSGSAAAGSIQSGMVGASGAHTYYISYTNGSDSNAGTSTAHPWKDAPGMQGFACTSSCSYTARSGDRFIFEGGDTWPNSEFPFATASGASGSQDYYGVETDWFIAGDCSGGTFCQPTFNAQNADICPNSCNDPNAPGGSSGGDDVFVDLAGQDYDTMDDIHLTNYYAGDSGGYHICSELLPDNDSNSEDNNITLNRLRIDNMFIGANSWVSTCYVVQAYSITQPADVSIIENSTIAGDSKTWGKAVWYFPNAVNNTIYGMGEGLLYPSGHGVIAGNTLYGCAANPTTGAPQSPSDGGSPTQTIHDNAIETLGASGSGIFYIHDNVIYNTGETSNDECESMILSNNGETDYVWNNVLYNIDGNGPTSASSSGGTNTADYYWNNSIQSDNADNVCIRANGVPTSVAENNLCVGSGTISGFNTTSNDVQITASQASSDGYAGTSGQFVWMPPSGSSPTSGTGANLTSHCSGSMTGLCSDTTYAGERTLASRPTSGSWDVGAYEKP